MSITTKHYVVTGVIFLVVGVGVTAINWYAGTSILIIGNIVCAAMRSKVV